MFGIQDLTGVTENERNLKGFSHFTKTNVCRHRLQLPQSFSNVYVIYYKTAFLIARLRKRVDLARQFN